MIRALKHYLSLNLHICSKFDNSLKFLDPSSVPYPPRFPRREAVGGCAAGDPSPKDQLPTRWSPGGWRKCKLGSRVSLWVNTAMRLRSMTSQGRSFSHWLEGISGSSEWRRWVTSRGSCKLWKSCSDDGEAAPREMAYRLMLWFYSWANWTLSQDTTVFCFQLLNVIVRCFVIKNFWVFGSGWCQQKCRICRFFREFNRRRPKIWY